MPTVSYVYDLTDIDDREEQRVHDRAQGFKCACQNFDEWLLHCPGGSGPR